MLTVGVLLAAGAGRRMGGPKALLRPRDEGPTLLSITADRLRDAGLERVIVVVGAEAETVGARAEELHLAVVTATDWAEGMGASLRAGLDAADALVGVDAALVTLVDLPDVGAAVYRRILGAAPPPGGGPRRSALLRAAYHGHAGHPVLLGRDHWDGVRASASGDRGARGYLAEHRPRLVECGDLARGIDLDTPDDLSALRGERTFRENDAGLPRLEP